MEPTVNVTVGLAASVEPVVTLTTPAVNTKLPLSPLQHCQGDRAKRLDALRKETHQYTPEKEAFLRG
jgi:hypothetical protein